MWNKEKMNALGTCKLSLQNPKTSQKYMVNFDVFSRKSSSPCQVPNQLRRWNIAKHITVNYNKFESVNGVVEDKHDTLQTFPDVFSEYIGALPALCN